MELINTTDMASIKQRYNVPEKLEGCHTALVEGYVVEGGPGTVRPADAEGAPGDPGHCLARHAGRRAWHARSKVEAAKRLHAGFEFAAPSLRELLKCRGRCCSHEVGHHNVASRPLETPTSASAPSAPGLGEAEWGFSCQWYFRTVILLRTECADLIKAAGALWHSPTRQAGFILVPNASSKEGLQKAASNQSYHDLEIAPMRWIPLVAPSQQKAVRKYRLLGGCLLTAERLTHNWQLNGLRRPSTWASKDSPIS
ncbi:hypothetical protein [Cupriavidus basilensis]